MEATVVNVSHAHLHNNMALSGGVLQAEAMTTVRMRHSLLTHNQAVHDGGAFLFEGVPRDAAPVIAWSNLRVERNSAVSGGGMFWRLALPYTAGAEPLASQTCVACRVVNNSGGNVATTGVRLSLWPVHAPVARTAVASGMTLGAYVSEPSERPRAAIVDALDQPTTLDNSTLCTIDIAAADDNTASVAPSIVAVSSGIVVMDTIAVRAAVNTTVHVRATCAFSSTLGGSVTQFVTYAARVQPCLPAWDLTDDRVCRRCLQGSYSQQGLLCKPCPSAGDCSAEEGDGETSVRGSIVVLVRAALVLTLCARLRWRGE